MFCKKKKNVIKLMFLGLDYAGKTSILKAMKTEDITKVHPTHGFDISNFEMEQCVLNIWDIGGEHTQRDYWPIYVESAHGVVYVIDGTAKDRLEEAGKALILLLDEIQLKGLPLLILVNKKDHKRSYTTQDITEKLSLIDIKDRKWEIIATSAKSGSGILQGFNWIVDQASPKSKIKEKKSKKPAKSIVDKPKIVDA